MKPCGSEELIDVARTTLEGTEREYQYAAIDLLAMHYHKFDTRHLPFLVELVQSRSWWDTVDALASVIGKILCPWHDGMDQAIAHENMWVRRIALLRQLGSRDKTDRDRCFPTR